MTRRAYNCVEIACAMFRTLALSMLAHLAPASTPHRKHKAYGLGSLSSYMCGNVLLFVEHWVLIGLVQSGIGFELIDICPPPHLFTPMFMLASESQHRN